MTGRVNSLEEQMMNESDESSNLLTGLECLWLAI